MIFLLVAAAVVVAAPLVAAVLVTVASLREDSAQTLTGRPPGLITAAARRLLCLRTGDSALRRQANSPPDADGLDFMSQVYPYVPQPRPAADEDAADHTLTLPRA